MKGILLAFAFAGFHLFCKNSTGSCGGDATLADCTGARRALATTPRRLALQVIPVIDLMDGEVVHARRGHRGSYGRLESPLSPTSDPVDVIRGLLSVYPFPTLYVAD